MELMNDILEQVVLVDEHDGALGEAEKLDAHRLGLLHRAFSVFAFNAEGKLLLQQRAHHKYHSGGLWSNTCCGHPRPDEPLPDAATRRLAEEMGIPCEDLRSVDVLRYRTRIDRLVENELDHLFVARVDQTPAPNPDEVAAWRHVGPEELRAWLAEQPDDFTAWFPLAWEKIDPEHTPR